MNGANLTSFLLEVNGAYPVFYVRSALHTCMYIEYLT